jgi:hypothetical protein
MPSRTDGDSRRIGIGIGIGVGVGVGIGVGRLAPPGMQRAP